MRTYLVMYISYKVFNILSVQMIHVYCDVCTLSWINEHFQPWKILKNSKYIVKIRYGWPSWRIVITASRIYLKMPDFTCQPTQALTRKKIEKIHGYCVRLDSWFVLIKIAYQTSTNQRQNTVYRIVINNFAKYGSCCCYCFYSTKVITVTHFI